MDGLRIFLADDHPMLRQGLTLFINNQSDMKVIGEAGDGASTIRMVVEQQPDVLVLDISMPGLNGQKLAKHLKQILPKIKIIAFTRHNEIIYLQALLRAGVDGYVLKQSSPEELICAIRRVVTGRKHIDQAFSDTLMNGYNEVLLGQEANKPSRLSERETEVLRLIAQGYSNKEIAARFDVSIKTIESQKAVGMMKLELQDRVDLIRYAMLHGWLDEV